MCSLPVGSGKSTCELSAARAQGVVASDKGKVYFAGRFTSLIVLCSIWNRISIPPVYGVTAGLVGGKQAPGGRERRLLPPRGEARSRLWEQVDAMDQAQNLRQQAERCFDLARGVTNRDAREQLEL